MWIYVCTAVLAALLLRNLYRGTLKIKDCQNRYVLITGCDHGFGRKLAEKLDNLGVHVFATCLHSSSVKELSEQCSSKMKALVMDVTNEDHIIKAIAFVEEHLKEKSLWCLVNNAGCLSPQVVFEMATKEDFRKVMNVNLFGMIDVTRAFIPLLRRGKEGRIVNVSSMNGRFSVEASPYSCSKYGVESFSDGLSFSLSPFNITIHTIQPGYYKTEMTNGDKIVKEIWERWDSLDERIKVVYGRGFIEQYCESAKKLYDGFAVDDSKPVVKAMTHAILGKHPQNRYVVGRIAVFFLRPVSLLPFPIAKTILNFLRATKAKPLAAKR